MPAHITAIKRVKSCALLLLALGLAAADQIPKFENYPAGEVYKGPAAKPVLATRFQRLYRTRIRQAAEEPANFAGHYKIAEWGCGAGCVQIAVIDVKSGAVSDGPFSLLSYDSQFTYEGDDQLEYRVTSRLLIARGCPQEKNCGTYYYEWNGKAFQRIRYAPAKPAK